MTYEDIRFLYESNSGQDAVYDIDPILFEYRYTADDGKEAKFNSIFEPSTFFTDISSLALQAENPSDVIDRKTKPLSTEFASTVPVKNAFDPNIKYNEYRIAITNGGAFPALSAIKEIYNEIDAKSTDQTSKSHVAMDIYMKDIIKQACLVRFKKAIDFINAGVVANSTDIHDVARTVISWINISELSSVLQIINDDARVKIKEIIKNSRESKEAIPTDLMQDFKYGKFKSPFYYRLRVAISEIPRNNTRLNDILKVHNNPSMMTLVLKILVDVYIKACYPLLHFQFINAMIDIYADEGDYVNSRIALLAKVAFTYNFVNALYSPPHYSWETNNNTTIEGGRSTYGEFKSTVLSLLNTYIKNMNGINIASPNSSSHPISTVVTTLHKKSKAVVDTNARLRKYKEEIANNQLALRNILQNYESLKRKYKNTLVEFYIVLVLLFLLIVVCTVLIIFKLPNYAQYIAGGVAILVAVVKAVEAINTYLTNK